jgi:hypothetical protein
MGRKPDLKQVDAAADHLGMSDAERIEFGDYLEECKAAGDGGSKNDRRDYIWPELLDKGREFLELTRGES